MLYLRGGGYSEAEEFLNYVKTKYGNDAYNDIAFILTEIDASNHPYLLDKPIKSLSTCNLADVMLLVACPVYEYMQLAARFRSKGMKEFTERRCCASSRKHGRKTIRWHL